MNNTLTLTPITEPTDYDFNTQIQTTSFFSNCFQVAGMTLIAVNNLNALVIPKVNLNTSKDKTSFIINVLNAEHVKYEDYFYYDFFANGYTLEEISRYFQIHNLVKNEFSKHSHYIESNLIDAKNQIRFASRLISKINFKQLAVELTPLNSIKYTLMLDNQIMVMISKPFSSIQDLKNDDVVFSVFKKRKLLVTDSQNLNQLILGLNKYVSK